MAISSINIGGQSITLVDMPTSPGFRTVQFDIADPSSTLTSGFSNKTQVQRWPGADILSGTVSLPVLTQPDADEWIAWLMALRGQSNAFLLGDPLKKSPRGQLQRSVPIVETSDPSFNLPGSDQLHIRGLNGAGALFEAGDWLQIGYRMYRNLFPVLSPDGKAVLTVFPTIREQPPDGTPIVTYSPAGLFRLGSSKRTWNADQTRLTTISFQFVEYRGLTNA